MRRVVVIPSLKPDDRLVSYALALREKGFDQVVVVDDGSGAAYAPIFEAAAQISGVTLLRHEVNRGKGAALKTAFAYLKESLKEPAVIATADSDGQHAKEDVWNVAERLEERLPGRVLALGTRDFSKDNVPFKSRAGNRITSVCFFLACRARMSDTQTGLRAFPSELLDEMLSIEGDRYEYEMRMLAYAARNRIGFLTCPIETVYENNNEGSHFNPWRDSVRIYRALFGPVLKYALASLMGTLVDFLAFYLLSALLFRDESLQGIAAATVLARLASAVANYLLNRHFVFRSQARGSALRYALLAVLTILASALAVYLGMRLLRWGLGPGLNAETAKTIIKAVADVLLFVANYHFCRKWVFPEGKG